MGLERLHESHQMFDPVIFAIRFQHKLVSGKWFALLRLGIEANCQGIGHQIIVIVKWCIGKVGEQPLPKRICPTANIPQVQDEYLAPVGANLLKSCINIGPILICRRVNLVFQLWRPSTR